MNTYNKLYNCLDTLRAKTAFIPELGLVLGSGLGDFAEKADIREEVAYGELEGFPVSTVAGHNGRFLFGYVGGVPVMIMQGRVHYYEGYGMSDVVLPVRLMGLCGIKKLILTNAAGGVNTSFRPGDMMLITDHISSFVPSPLIGKNDERLGARFPDMSNVYDEKLRAVAETVAHRENLPLKSGVYMQLQGPNYETPAEIRMCRVMGADAVGMSTAVEAMAARHMGLRVCGISCITNMAAGIEGKPLSHEEVKETAALAGEAFTRLVKGVITAPENNHD